MLKCRLCFRKCHQLLYVGFRCCLFCCHCYSKPFSRVLLFRQKRLFISFLNSSKWVQISQIWTARPFSTVTRQNSPPLFSDHLYGCPSNTANNSLNFQPPHPPPPMTMKVLPFRWREKNWRDAHLTRGTEYRIAIWYWSCLCYSEILKNTEIF